jgi:hypothetical protein
MRFLVHLLINNSTTVVAHLSVTIKPSQVILQYLNDDGALVASDNLSAYQFFHVDLSNHRQCIFRSQLIDRTIVFQRDNESTEFLSLMTKSGVFSAVPNNPFSFTISIPQSQPSGFFGYFNRMYRDIPGISRQVDGIVMGAIEQTLPSNSLTRLSPTDVNCQLFSNISIPRSVFPTVFSRLLDVKNCPTADYLKVKKQWELTSHAEWDHFYGLRVFVRSTDEWLERSEIVHKRHFFNVCLSLFTYKFGDLKPPNHPQIMFLVAVIFAAFLTGECLNGKILAQDGAELSDEEAESIVFWHAKVIIEKAAAATFSMLKESLSIRALLSTISGSTLEMLNDRNVMSFDFAFREAVLLFSNGRPVEDMLLLSAAAIASGDLRAFYQNGIAASLVLLQDKLQVVAMNRTEAFYEAYTEELKGLDVRLLLYNIERMIASTRH